MKKTIDTIRNSWTWNHKALLFALGLLTAQIYQVIPFPEPEVVEYTRTPLVDTSIEYKLQQRARELYKENEAMDLEKYRLEAIRELNSELLGMMDDSPFIDYKNMQDKYGY